MGPRPNPSIYEINTRVVLGEIGRALGRPATLDDLPDAMLDRIAAWGLDYVWMLGVWQTGEAGPAVSRSKPDWLEGYRRHLPDLADADICGSPFAIVAYEVHRDFGGDAALARLRERLKSRGIGLFLDFVPNHVALDHPWATEHPQYLMPGSDDDLAREPQNFIRIGSRVLAYGRDPYFDGWPDTLQLNYRHGGFREAMKAILARIATLADGVRCDMAMLVLPEIFRRTWGDRSIPRDGTAPVDSSFWPEAIAAARLANPGFLFMAEAYWDLEWTLQQQGFDATYDKRLYDRLAERHAEPVRWHLGADMEYQRKSVRFLENHDEPRAAEVFPEEVQRAAAVVAYTSPGVRFFHEGQFEGRSARAVIHLARRLEELARPELARFYDRLLAAIRRPELRDGKWIQLWPSQAWDGNPTHNNFIAACWSPADRPDARVLVVVNFASTQAQSRLRLDWPEAVGRSLFLSDAVSEAIYERKGEEANGLGIFFDLPAWGYHVFTIE